MPMTFDQFESVAGAARILVDREACELDWSQLRKLIDPAFLRVALAPGQHWFRANCAKWYGSRKPIGREMWYGIEVWRSPCWRSLTRDAWQGV